MVEAQAIVLHVKTLQHFSIKAHVSRCAHQEPMLILLPWSVSLVSGDRLLLTLNIPVPLVTAQAQPIVCLVRAESFIIQLILVVFHAVQVLGGILIT